MDRALKPIWILLDRIHSKDYSQETYQTQAEIRQVIIEEEMSGEKDGDGKRWDKSTYKHWWTNTHDFTLSPPLKQTRSYGWKKGRRKMGNKQHQLAAHIWVALKDPIKKAIKWVHLSSPCSTKCQRLCNHWEWNQWASSHVWDCIWPITSGIVSCNHVVEHQLCLVQGIPQVHLVWEWVAGLRVCGCERGKHNLVQKASVLKCSM